VSRLPKRSLLTSTTYWFEAGKAQCGSVSRIFDNFSGFGIDYLCDIGVADSKLLFEGSRRPGRKVVKLLDRPAGEPAKPLRLAEWVVDVLNENCLGDI
jgi:hypothetical protein